MERDFLGIGRKDSGDLLKGDCLESAIGSAVEWPLLNKISALQLCSSLNTVQEKPKNPLFDQNSLQPIPKVVAFEANHKTSASQALPQKCFNLERYGMQNFSNPTSLNQDMSNYCVSAHHAHDARFPVVLHNSDPIASKSPFFPVHDSSSGPALTVTSVKPFGNGYASNNPWVGSAVGVCAPRKVMKPQGSTAQLTIFYAGSVNVYEDVPLEKAQTIMLMANEAYKTTANAVNPKTETLELPLAKGSLSDALRVAQTPNPVNNYKMSSCSSVPSTLALASHIENQFDTSSIPTNAMIGAKGNEAPIQASQNDPSKSSSTSMCATTASTILPRAVPQARKASLARFLEKRKERANTAMPYSIVDKMPLKNSTMSDAATSSSKSSSAHASVSSNQDSWFTGEAKKSDCNDRTPNTKLEM
ncbi:hypothetical protein HPP92_023490 [Vanilla planifolia]|uniref:Protein TIFY n=1 Tax=Vanilla planifolia TaxID=51239 RepID=A0A835UEI1_VANPL|nr:hypothetical protein HPP92_023490 [Vanilla planifolia]